LPILCKPNDFPPYEKIQDDGLIDIGGHFSNALLLKAYSLGIFPWFMHDGLIFWYCPLQRALLFPEEVVIQKSMRPIINLGKWQYKWDTCFRQTILLCRSVHENRSGSWINDEFIVGYCRLHEAGYAHSLEIYEGSRLIGGLYGVSLGNFFSGESMFNLVPNASKYAIIILAQEMKRLGYHFIDCQILNPFTQSMGAVNVECEIFLQMLKEAMKHATHIGSWTYR